MVQFALHVYTYRTQISSKATCAATMSEQRTVGPNIADVDAEDAA